jgi:hypothetical protein
MATVIGLNPYDLSNLLSGPCRVLYAPLAQAIPTKLKDILAVEGEYKPAGEWKNFGATSGPGSYGRQFATSGLQIEQATGDVDQEVTDAVRTISAPFSEITPELLQIMEQSASVGTVAKAAGYSAEKQVKFGTVASLGSYRIAIISRRRVGLGADVTQKDAVMRGAMVASVLYRAKIVGDQASLQVARGQASSAQLTFQAYPDSTQTSGQEHGVHMLEQAGTIE